MPTKKIIGEVKSFVIEELARFSKPREIVQTLKKRYGILVLEGSIYAAKKRNREEIARARKQYMADLDSIPLRHRKVRILRLAQYLEAAEKGVPVAVKTVRGIEYRVRPDYHLSLKILERIRDEVRDAEQRFDEQPAVDIRITLADLQQRYAAVHTRVGKEAPVSVKK